MLDMINVFREELETMQIGAVTMVFAWELFMSILKVLVSFC